MNYEFINNRSHLPKYMLTQLKTFLNQAFPKGEHKWRSIILISFFVPLFLLIFQPFGLSNLTFSLTKLLFIAGYGFVTLIVLIIDLVVLEKISPSFFEDKNWKVWKELLFLGFVIFTIGLGNIVYTGLLTTNSTLSFAIILKFQLITFAIAIFPITIFTTVKYHHLLQRYTSSASDFNNQLNTSSSKASIGKTINLPAYNGKKEISFDANHFLVLESKGNNIEIILMKDNKIIKETLRNSLKNALVYFGETPEISQCHRAFIVNTKKIEKASGNSQGLLLQVKDYDIEIPVSRSFVSSIKSQIS